MKKIILTILFVAVYFIAFAQKYELSHEKYSVDSTYKAECYRVEDSKSVEKKGKVMYNTHIVLYYLKENRKKTIPIYNIIHLPEHTKIFRILVMDFSGDNFYFASRMVSYKYNIKTEKLTKLFEDYNKGTMCLIKVVGDTLEAWGTKPTKEGQDFIHKVDNSILYVKTYKYYDGKYISSYTKPEVYYDVSTGNKYINGKLVDEDNEEEVKEFWRKHKKS